MIVKQSTSFSVLQSIKDLISTSLLTTTQTCFSTIQDFMAEFQSNECNRTAARNDLQQLSSLFSLQFQLIEQLKPYFESNDGIMDSLKKRLNEKRNGELTSYGLLSISTSKRWRVNEREERELSSNTQLPLQLKIVKPFTIPHYHLPQLSSPTAISFFKQYIIPVMTIPTEMTSFGMTMGTFMDIITKSCCYTNMSIDLVSGRLDFQKGILEIGHYYIQLSVNGETKQRGTSKISKCKMIISDNGGGRS